MLKRPRKMHLQSKEEMQGEARKSFAAVWASHPGGGWFCVRLTWDLRGRPPRHSLPSDGPQTAPTIDPNEVSTNCFMKSQDLGKQSLSFSVGSGNT